MHCRRNLVVLTILVIFTLISFSLHSLLFCDMLVIYNGFNYIALFLISIYFLIAIFLIVAVQQTQLHPNCKSVFFIFLF